MMAAAIASAMPVLPEVASISVSPGLISPRSSARSSASACSPRAAPAGSDIWSNFPSTWRPLRPGPGARSESACGQRVRSSPRDGRQRLRRRRRRRRSYLQHGHSPQHFSWEWEGGEEGMQWRADTPRARRADLLQLLGGLGDDLPLERLEVRLCSARLRRTGLGWMVVGERRGRGRESTLPLFAAASFRKCAASCSICIAGTTTSNWLDQRRWLLMGKIKDCLLLTAFSLASSFSSFRAALATFSFCCRSSSDVFSRS